MSKGQIEDSSFDAGSRILPATASYMKYRWVHAVIGALSLSLSSALDFLQGCSSLFVVPILG